MKTTFLFLIAALLSSFNICGAQNIIAGQVTINDTYNDPADTSIKGLAYHLAPPGGTIFLDVDGDSYYDFYISAYGGGGLGGGSGGCSISGCGNASLATRIDTVTGGSAQNQYILTVADSLEYGDTISNNMTFSSGATLWATVYGMQQGPCLSSWTNIGEHYIGFRITYPFETSFGWLRVEGTGGGLSFTFTIKDYAYNINHNYSSVNNAFMKNRFSVYPNPFNDKLIFNLHSSEQSEVILYDVTYRKVLEQIFINNVTLGTESLHSGLYFYEIRNDKKIISKGKVVKV